MEMNTRLQVEHPVTELSSGVDIVKAQFDIASGKSIADITFKEEGYAIELRLTAEKIIVDSDGVMQLPPDPGTITKCFMPAEDNIELISIADTNKEDSTFHVSLIANAIRWGDRREDAIV